MPISNVVGFDDCPFDRAYRGNVNVIGTICAQTRLEGVLRGSVRRDGANATQQLIRLVRQSKFIASLQLVLLQGIALAGFNVVDARRLSEELGLPVLIVARRQPQLERIRRTLLEVVPGGARKWKLIENMGEMEPCAGVYVQRVGISLTESQGVIRRCTLH